MFFYRSLGDLALILFQEKVTLSFFWNIFIFISLCVLLSNNMHWPTECVQDCFLKRTVSEHSPWSPEIVLFFQKMASIRSDHPSQWSCSPDVPGTFFFKFKFPKGGKKVCFENLVLLKTSPSWSAFHKLPTYFS